MGGMNGMERMEWNRNVFLWNASPFHSFLGIENLFLFFGKIGGQSEEKAVIQKEIRVFLANILEILIKN
ncbi:hypothetical protein BpHYR1_036918 [Brachionus plicatilis]|uniref:Uncharacterized protein n=1 Tax=Brachionus plicatilis TaxID=10195 RepID=A0A3M7QL14_BRAPC|nr:hypothetical protein BpHYR1_036918 [Brachionus plicatilis]